MSADDNKIDEKKMKKIRQLKIALQVMILLKIKQIL